MNTNFALVQYFTTDTLEGHPQSPQDVLPHLDDPFFIEVNHWVKMFKMNYL